MNKKHIILLHGALGCEIQLTPLARLLEDRFSVSTLNFEGHGDRPSDQNFTMDLFVDNVIQHLEDRGIEKTHIFGYSMGGYVALMLARKRPDLVSNIMTLGTKFDWTPEIAAREVKMLDPIKIEAKVPTFGLRLSGLHTANDWKNVMRKTADMMMDLGSGKGLSDEDLKMIKSNVVIGLGQLDNMVTSEESERAASLITNAEFISIEGFKHPIEKVDLRSLSAIIRQLF